MKQTILKAALAAAALFAVFVCGYKAAAIKAGDRQEITADAAAVKEMEEAGLKDNPAVELTVFASDIQNAVSGRDIEALASLCDYPLYISTEDGQTVKIESAEDFAALGADTVFTRSLIHEIGLTIPCEQQKIGLGVVMGNQNNIVFNRMNGNFAITSINLGV